MSRAWDMLGWMGMKDILRVVARILACIPGLEEQDEHALVAEGEELVRVCSDYLIQELMLGGNILGWVAEPDYHDIADGEGVDHDELVGWVVLALQDAEERYYDR